MKIRDLSLIILAAMLLVSCEQPKPLNVLYPVGDFSLVESSGKPLKKADLLGRVWVGNFFFATCPGVCKELNGGMRKIDQEFHSNEKFRLVSISTDSEHDTPEVLAAYAKDWNASANWLFLTGPKADIYRLSIEGFKLALQENGGSREPIIHSAKMVLVDKAGNIRGYYDGVGGSEQGSDAPTHLASEQKRLVADIRRLLAE
jgi:protein SCO1/2